MEGRRRPFLMSLPLSSHSLLNNSTSCYYKNMAAEQSTSNTFPTFHTFIPFTPFTPIDVLSNLLLTHQKPLTFPLPSSPFFFSLSPSQLSPNSHIRLPPSPSYLRVHHGERELKRQTMRMFCVEVWGGG